MKTKLKIRQRIVNWLKKGSEESASNYNTSYDRAPEVPMKDEMHETYLFDFQNWGADRGQYVGEVAIATTDPTSAQIGVAYGGFIAQPPAKIKMKPVDVVNELEVEPTIFNLNNLDDKISVLKDKEKLLTQHYAKREVTALIERLELRKKYPDHKAYFDQYKNTTDEKIGKLLEKYDLVMKTSDIFIPEFPDDAISVMKSYTEKVEELCGKKPVFYVIAENQHFRKAYDKRDPILLVQSPFGFFWQILGAWDKEMLLLGEL
jgi:hypothetical protein